MGAFSYADKLLLGVLLPLWLVFLGFHIKEIKRTGFAAPPIYAAASAESRAIPRSAASPWNADAVTGRSKWATC